MDNKRFDYLWQYVEYWSALDPNFTAMQFEGRSYSYHEFELLTDKIATEFLHLGVKKGDIIASMLPSSPEYIMALIAADKIGAIITALDVNYKTADLKKSISHVKPKVVLALARCEEFDIAQALKSFEVGLMLQHPIQYFFIGKTKYGQSFENIYQGKSEFKDELLKCKTSQHPDDGMVVIFTGGTTGVPKAALLSKQNVTAMAVVESEIINKAIEQVDVTSRIKTIVCLPPSHVGGTVELIGSSSFR
jgi:acyl-CoA synthetase (AMP-forming)/AMP-acid ligase II